ncbi:uncharacterized protein LOC135120483 [Zophobas morio]|uniref:uncharacterized protein LOC135120483 n=1 Tax=Zophobas morio TaxID=2755281 RepID=UPI003083ED50
MFKGLNKLQILHLSDNNIKSIAANSFRLLTGLTSLFLSRNPITEIGPDAFGLTFNYAKFSLSLNKTFLCCSRVLYPSLRYSDSSCTYRGALEEYNSFAKKKCYSSSAASAQKAQKKKVVRLDLPLKVLVNSSTNKNQNVKKRVSEIKKIKSDSQVKNQWPVESYIKKIKNDSLWLGYGSGEELTAKRRDRGKKGRLLGSLLVNPKYILIITFAIIALVIIISVFIAYKHKYFKRNFDIQFRNKSVDVSATNPLFKDGVYTGYNSSVV